MTAERWKRIEVLYYAALEREPAERDGFLGDACAGDEDLKREVVSLLAQDSSKSWNLDRPAWVYAAGLPEENHAHQFESGDQLGPYQLVSKIGQGGMGAVFRAHDARIGRDVAIKIASARFSDRFERESHAIAALNHPNICTLYDVGPNYLVMELLEGETLAARLGRGALPADEILRYAEQIANALAEAHRVGIVHRDLKPSNIILSRNGVKVLDFGIAKIATDPGLTETNDAVGTPAYMAPEQLRGKSADARSDLFSLGLVLYETTAGRLPFPGSSLGSMLNSAPVNLPPLPKVPNALKELILRLLEKEPANRTQTAVEVRDVVHKCARAGPFGRRAMIAAAVLLLLGVGVFGTQAYLRRSRARWAQNEALPEVARLMHESRWLAATDLLRQAERYASPSAELIHLKDLVPTTTVTIETDPPGADVYIRDYTSPDDKASWQPLGRSPVTTDRLPHSNYQRGYYVIRAVKSGFEPVQQVLALGAITSPNGGEHYAKIGLHSTASSPPGMVWAPPAWARLGWALGRRTPFPDFGSTGSRSPTASSNSSSITADIRTARTGRKYFARTARP